MKKAKKLLETGSKFDRRDFLLTSATALGGMMLPQFTMEAQAAAPRKKVVVVFLRGGMDGLSLVAPHRAGSGTQSNNYKTYKAKRGSLALTNPSPLAGTNFDLNPTCKRIHSLYNHSAAIFIPGAGSTNGTRSHFVQQDSIENGNPDGGNVAGGYLNRALGLIPAGARSEDMPAVTIGNGVDKALLGGNAVSVPNLNTGLTINGIDAGMPLDARLQKLWSAVEYVSPRWVDYLLKGAGVRARRSLDVIEEASRISASQISPNSGTLDDNFHHYAGMSQFQTALRLMKSDPELRFLTINVEGWDHHVNLGANDGTFYNLMGKLDRALGAFAYDLNRAGLWDDTRIVVMSEFGRRVAINGASGVDHGRGGTMMVLGGNLNGKRVLSRDYSLQNLDGGDVRVTVDYRDVIAEILVRFQGISMSQLHQIFPGYLPKFLGIL